MSPDEAIDPEDDVPRLFLLTPGDVPPERLVPALDLTLAGGGVAGVRVRAEAPAPLLDACRRRGVACFLPEPETALALAADGVLVDGREDIEALRARLGEERLLGALCGTSRHAAMTVGEAGADFVAFGGEDHALSKRLVDLVVWWNELFVLPCLALGRFDPHAAGVLARAGADLIAVHLEADDVTTARLDAFRQAVAPQAAHPDDDRG